MDKSSDELIIEAKLENLDTVVDFIDTKITNCKNCSIKTQNQIKIAIDEIFSNIVRYAYSPEVGNVVVRIATTDEAIVIEFEDNGIPYNPLTQEAPNVSLSIDEREPGGLGIFLVKNIMDTVEYRYINNTNIFIIKKYLGKNND